MKNRLSSPLMVTMRAGAGEQRLTSADHLDEAADRRGHGSIDVAAGLLDYRLDGAGRGIGHEGVEASELVGDGVEHGVHLLLVLELSLTDETVCPVERRRRPHLRPTRECADSG